MYYYPIPSVDKILSFAILRVQHLVTNLHWLLGSVITVIYSTAVNTVWVITNNKSCFYSTKLRPIVGSHKFSEIFLKPTSEYKSHCGMITILAHATAGKYDAKIKHPKNMFLFTAFLFNFSHLHIKITPASQINNCFCSLFFAMCILHFTFC
jgi:hypothetical protein